MATNRTVSDLIRAVVNVLGLYAPSEALIADDQSVILDAIQDLLAEWSDAGLIVPCLTTEPVTLVVAKASYTIGQSGSPDLNTVRPENIIGAYVRSGTTDNSVEIIGKTAYDAISDKTSAGRPDKLYPSYSAPNMTIYLYPVPDAIESLYITSHKPFTEPTLYSEQLLNTTGIPRNYYNALKFNVALDVAPIFNQQAPALVTARAMQTKRTIINLNAARRTEAVGMDVAAMDGSSSGGGNIMTG